MNQSEMLALGVLIAGVIGVPLVQGIKKLMAATGHPLEGMPALYVTVAASVVLAAVVLFLSGAFSQPFSIEMVGAVVAGIFAVATVIYKKITEGQDQGVK